MFLVVEEDKLFNYIVTRREKSYVAKQEISYMRSGWGGGLVFTIH